MPISRQACGFDGCFAQCGACPSGQACEAGQCVSYTCVADCGAVSGASPMAAGLLRGCGEGEQCIDATGVCQAAEVDLRPHLRGLLRRAGVCVVVRGGGSAVTAPRGALMRLGRGPRLLLRIGWRWTGTGPPEGLPGERDLARAAPGVGAPSVVTMAAVAPVGHRSPRGRALRAGPASAPKTLRWGHLRRLLTAAGVATWCGDGGARHRRL